MAAPASEPSPPSISPGADTRERWRAGSWQGLLHASLLCVLQPAIPAATIAAFRPWIWTPEDTLARSIPAWVPPAAAVSAALTLALVLGLGLFGVARLRLAAIGWVPEPPGRVVLLGVLGAAASTAALLTTAALFGGDAGAGLRQMIGYSPSQRAMFAVIGIALATYEESLFRGYLQQQLEARLGCAAALVLTAVLYAAYHFPLGVPESMVARLGQGLIYGALRGRAGQRGSLAAPALAHALCWAFVGLY